MPARPAPAPEALAVLAGRIALAARLFLEAKAAIGSGTDDVGLAVLADAMRSLDHTIRTAGPCAAAIAAAHQDGWDACEAAHAELAAEERRRGGHLRVAG
jgi:hypothetical protein